MQLRDVCVFPMILGCRDQGKTGEKMVSQMVFGEIFSISVFNSG